MTRSEHLQWCKDRAMEFVEKGDYPNAYTSMCSDLGKHPGTEGHSGISLGMALMMGGKLSNYKEMSRFINGFN